MKIKTNVRAGKGSSSKSVNSVVTFVSALISQFVNRCSGI
jgi:hypothetical protein